MERKPLIPPAAKIILGVFVFLGLLVCLMRVIIVFQPPIQPATVQATPEQSIVYTNMPPEFELLTDGNGKFNARFIKSKVILIKSGGVSKKAAIERAWSQYNFMYPASDGIDWKPCTD